MSNWLGDALCRCGHVLDAHDVFDSDGNPYGVTLPCQRCSCVDWTGEADNPPTPLDELALRRARQEAS